MKQTMEGECGRGLECLISNGWNHFEVWMDLCQLMEKQSEIKKCVKNLETWVVARASFLISFVSE